MFPAKNGSAWDERRSFARETVSLGRPSVGSVAGSGDPATTEWAGLGRAAVPAASSHLLWRGQETTPQQCGTVTFEGKSFKELKKSFKDSVDDYLASCAERDEQPDKPYSGTLRLRLAPELHHRAATAAALAGKV